MRAFDILDGLPENLVNNCVTVRYHYRFHSSTPSFVFTLTTRDVKHFNKFKSSFLRIKFLRKCLDNDIIPDFLRFRVPDNGIFSDQAVHSFQLRLLRSELSQANADRAKASVNLVKAKEVVRRGIDEKWWPSVIFYLNRQARCSVNNLISRRKRKPEKLSERQNRLIKNLDERAVRILDEVILPLWVREVLSFGPKHPVRDKFN